MTSIKQVVVLGGGFGGVNAAQTILSKIKNVEVTLIDPKKDFVFTPLIHEVAASQMPEDLVRTPYSEIFTDSRFKHIQEYATDINFEKNTVLINEQEIQYDILVLGTGATSIKPVGNGTNTHELKTLQDAINIHQALKDLKDEPMNIAIVGGGATGVEMALETRTFLSKYKSVKIYLITRDNDILLRFHPSLHKCAKARLEQFKIETLTNTEISKIEGNSLTLHDRTLETKMILWTVGVKPHYPFAKENLEFDERGRVLTDKFLRLNKYKNVYCVGDIVSGFQMDAQSAVWHGKYVGKNISNQLNNQELEINKYQAMGELISLGEKYAAGRMFGLTLKGTAIWFIWRTTYLFKIPTLKKKFEVGLNWFLLLLTL